MSGTSTYALEAFRLAALRKRKRLILGVTFLVLGLLTYNAFSGVSNNPSISTLGGQGSGIGLPSGEGGGASPQRGPSATVTLTTGRLSLLDKDIGPNARPDEPAGTGGPQAERSQPITTDTEFIQIGWASVARFLLVIYLIYRIARWALRSVRDAYGEVNFGIFKGADPIELHLTEKNLRRTIIRQAPAMVDWRTPTTTRTFTVVGRR